MLIKTYQANISDSDIESALACKETELPPELQLELEEAKRKYRKNTLGLSSVMIFFAIVVFFIGRLFEDSLLGGGIMMSAGAFALYAIWQSISKLVFSSKRNSQEDPFELMRSYSDMVLSTIESGTTLTDYSSGYKLLAPSTMRNTSLINFSDDQEKIREDVFLAMKSQEKAVCSGCQRENRGLWSVEPYNFSNEELSKNDYFVQCGGCGNTYCASCFQDLIETGICSSCDEKLAGHSSKIFLHDPVINITSASIEDISAETDVSNEDVAHLQAIIDIRLKLKKPLEPESLYVDKYCYPADTGRVSFHFRNSAVKISEKWFLVGALSAG